MIYDFDKIKIINNKLMPWIKIKRKILVTSSVHAMKSEQDIL